ncbi:DUF916 and DUF3324 domain-containing protein [Furfurilactobacillus sp. WILCCON 0119]|uniref:DUF916 and DUF3324 domain-containing protein n=1 Tax=Furfurilactobacillus entadae TaxID=2922307 RepID=UPI0035E977AF
MKKKWVGVLTLLLSIFLVGTLQAHADDNQVGFSVSPVLPSNQYDNQASFFKLQVKPNEKQSLSLVIANNTDQEAQYTVTPTSATTNENGAIDYSATSKKQTADQTTPMHTLLSAKQTVTVPARDSKRVTFTLSTPKKQFAGVILGGFLVEQVDQKNADQNKQDGQLSLTNKYAYVIGVEIRESAKAVKHDVSLGAVKASTVNAHTVIQTNIENKQPEVLKNLTVTTTVTKQNGKDKVSAKKEALALAPQSTMKLGTQYNDKKLAAGKYQATVTVKQGNQTLLNEKRDFTVSKDEVNRAKNQAVASESVSMPWYSWLIIGLLAVVIIALGIIIWQLFKNKRK